MLKKASTMIILALWMLVLAACSNDAQGRIDPMSIEASLRAEPETPAAGSPVKLEVTFTGGELPKSSSLTFEIRHEGKSVMQDAVLVEMNRYDCVYSFPEPGSYEIYMHLSTDDNHVTKMQQLTVQ